MICFNLPTDGDEYGCVRLSVDQSGLNTLKQQRNLSVVASQLYSLKNHLWVWFGVHIIYKFASVFRFSTNLWKEILKALDIRKIAHGGICSETGGT